MKQLANLERRFWWLKVEKLVDIFSFIHYWKHKMATGMSIESVYPYGSTDEAAVLLKVCKPNEKFVIHVPFHEMNSLHQSNRAKYLTCFDGDVKNMDRHVLMNKEVCAELHEAFQILHARMTATELMPFMNSFIWLCIADVPSDEVTNCIQIFNYIDDNYKIYDLYDDCCGNELTALYEHNFLSMKCSRSIVFHPEIIPLLDVICVKCGLKMQCFEIHITDVVGEIKCRRCKR